MPVLSHAVAHRCSSALKGFVVGAHCFHSRTKRIILELNPQEQLKMKKKTKKKKPPTQLKAPTLNLKGRCRASSCRRSLAQTWGLGPIWAQLLIPTDALRSTWLGRGSPRDLLGVSPRGLPGARVSGTAPMAAGCRKRGSGLWGCGRSLHACMFLYALFIPKINCFLISFFFPEVQQN